MPNTLKTIAVATDFSENAELALRWAISLASAHQATLVIVHASQADGAVSELVEAAPESQVRKELRSLESVASSAAIKATSQVHTGRPWEVIAEAAQQANADLIVVGTRGRTGYKRLLLGSTADRLIRSSNLPVLVVHPNDPVPQSGLKTILVPVDFSEESALATSMAVRLLSANPTGGRIVLLHAIELIVEWPTPDMPTVQPRYWDESEATARRQLDAIAASMRSDSLRVDVHTFRGYAPDAIEQEAENCGADVIAMGTRGRGALDRLLIGSVAERVLHHATRPVLTVRHPDRDQPIHVSV